MQVSLGVRSVRNICETRGKKKLRSYCEQLIKQYKRLKESEKGLKY
jgi:hypothetical protein